MIEENYFTLPKFPMPITWWGRFRLRFRPMQVQIEECVFDQKISTLIFYKVMDNGVYVFGKHEVKLWCPNLNH